MNDSLAVDLPGLAGAGLSQHARLITLQTALGDGLVPEAMLLDEAVNGLFSIEVMALSTSAQLDVAELLGEELTLTLLQPDHSRRAWHGVCTAAGQLGADGGLARYRLLLEPALAALRQRRDSYIFQNKDVRAIVMELLADYPLVRCEFDISEALPVRTICTQYEESDFEFFTRVLASEGLSWRFEHLPAGEGQARHKLVVFDARALAPSMPGGELLRFHGVRAADSDDAVDRFSAQRELRANAVALSSWDPAAVMAPGSERHSALDAGEVPDLSIYDGGGERLLADQEQADVRSRVMLRALEVENKRFDGAGAVRRLAAGCRFSLTQHERFPPGSNEFTVLAVRHEARNNFQAGLGAEGGIEAGTYRNSFTCVRSSVAIVPPSAALMRPRTAPGPQSALVVGLAGSVATSNRDHQVLVQFPWQRGHRPNDGGLAHDLDADGCAPGNDASGTWVRVAEAIAGPNWGSVFTPRVGTETLIDFTDGDVDRPVVVGQLYNGMDRLPFPTGVDSGAQQPGVLSGIHARSFDGSGFAQWVVDDSAGQLRMRLASSCASTQLNLGYLVERAATPSQRGDYLARGFELRTDGWTVIRGGEAVYLTTSARRWVACGVESTQMDMAEALDSLKYARTLARELADAVQCGNIMTSEVAKDAQSDFANSLDPSQADEHPPGQIEFTGRAFAQAGRDPDNRTSESRSRRPTVLLDSISSHNWTTQGSTAIYGAAAIHWSSGGDLQTTGAQAFSSSSGVSSTLLTLDGGIIATASSGTVSIESHTNSLEIIGSQEITVISSNEKIGITAKQRIILRAGQSAVILDGSDVTFSCPGTFRIKGSEHTLNSGRGDPAKLGKFPDSRLKLYDEAFVLKDKRTGMLLANHPYRITRTDGTHEDGITDANGETHIVTSTEIEDLVIKILSNR